MSGKALPCRSLAVTVLNLNQLRNFMLMWDEETFVAAARKAGVTSQGFTKSIRSLEAEIGVPLFSCDDAGRQRPTAYAEAVRAFCQQTLDAYRDMREDIGRMQAADRSPLAVAVASGTLSLLGIDFFDSYRALHPEVELVCVNASDLDVEARVLAGDAELGITVLPALDGLESRPLGTSGLYVWVPASDPLSRRTSITMSDLDGRHVALVGPNYKGYQNFEAMCRRGEVRPASVTALPENSMLHKFALDGRGVAFTSEHLVPLFAEDDAVVALPVRVPPVEVGLVWACVRELTPQAVAFIDGCLSRPRGLAGKIREMLGR